MSNDEVAFLTVDLGRADRQRYEGDWHWLATYRHAALPKDVSIYNVRTGELATPHLHLAAAPIELEPGKGGSGEVAIWEKRTLDDDHYLRIWEVMNRGGHVAQQMNLPPGSWEGYTVATSRSRMPVGVRAKEKKKSSLSRILGNRYEDFYSPDRMIIGVYGSPDGKRVAFLEELSDHLPGARMSLKVIAVSGGAPVVAADDAWPWSHVAWSPDGKKIAYTRAEDGRIAIARVPPIAKLKTGLR